MYKKMSICPKCSGLCLCKILAREEIVHPPTIAEINEVIGRLDLRPLNISERVCQTPRWRRAASASRWPKS